MVERRFQVCLIIDENTEIALRQAGGGNKSEGVRLLAKEWAVRQSDEHDLGKDDLADDEDWEDVL